MNNDLSYFVTNPTLSTPIVPGDKILVLGCFDGA